MEQIFIPIDEKEAWIAFIMSMSYSDGKWDSEESDRLLEIILQKKKVFADFDSNELSFLIKRFINLINKYGAKQLAHASSQYITDHYKETVFIIACETLLSNGELSSSECELIYSIGKTMQFSDQFIKTAIELSTFRVRGN